MQIKEVQEKLKISSYTLRYYEKMGLIQPYRDENGYRNYNEEDIHKIERIMFLRDINVPIEDIKDILDNKVTFQDVLENHIEKVNTPKIPDINKDKTLMPNRLLGIDL